MIKKLGQPCSLETSSSTVVPETLTIFCLFYAWNNRNKHTFELWREFMHHSESEVFNLLLGRCE